MNLVKELNKTITKVYENEQEFINKFFSHLPYYTLDEFYMASERCKVKLWYNYSLSIEDIVLTQDVLDWLEELDN